MCKTGSFPSSASWCENIDSPAAFQISKPFSGCFWCLIGCNRRCWCLLCNPRSPVQAEMRSYLCWLKRFTVMTSSDSKFPLYVVLYQAKLLTIRSDLIQQPPQTLLWVGTFPHCPVCPHLTHDPEVIGSDSWLFYCEVMTEPFPFGLHSVFSSRIVSEMR